MAAAKKAKKTSDDVLQTIDKDAVLLTKEGLQRLKDELHDLETSGRKRIAERLQEAIAFGDLSENAEYQEAKEEQSFIEGRIIELQRMIKHAQIISEDHKVGKVNLGSTVELKNKTLGEKEVYSIVGSTEVDIWTEPKKISNESALGALLLGKKKGDVFTVTAPAGNFEYELVSVK